jgi:hypothetical protein
MPETVYHRLATSQKNQDFHTVLDQVSSREIWGTYSMYGSGIPTVRAFRGPLPAGKDGIEFSTSIPPTPNSSTPTEVYWKLHEQSPKVLPSKDGDFARISATIRLIRYTSEASLLPRCEWSPS